MSSFRAWLEANLGRCTRCITLTTLFILVSWVVVAAIERMGRSNTTILAAATLIAVIVSALGIAHLAAFLTRRIQSLHGASREATTIARAPGDCGCRGPRNEANLSTTRKSALHVAPPGAGLISR
jgi:hypothetical protein